MKRLMSVPGGMRQSQGGFALLEVLVAVLLLSLGLLGMIGLQAHAIQFSAEAEMRNRAALLTNDITTAMWLSNTVELDIEAGDENSWTNKVKAQLPDGALEIDQVDAESVPNSADITITWSPPQRATGQSTQSQLTTRVTLPPST